MTIERKSIVDQIEITRSGMVQIRFALLLLEDGKEVASRFHRTAFDPSIKDAGQLQMYAVNIHLVEMGEKPVGQEDIDKVLKHASLTQT